MREMDECRSPAGAERAPLPPSLLCRCTQKIANQWQCVGVVSLWNVIPFISDK